MPAELSALVEGPGALAPARALDIGCGTGTQAVYLASLGWQVTGLDAVGQPLTKARGRAQAAGVEVNWVKGDVAALSDLGLEPGFTLLHDRGCFHGLPERARDAYASGVGELAAPGATLLLMAFAPNRKLAGPTGAAEDEIRSRFEASWDLTAADADAGPAPSGPMRDVPRTWYRLTRR